MIYLNLIQSRFVFHRNMYVEAWAPVENDFVNVNAVECWQQAMSAVKCVWCRAECNDSQDNWSQIRDGFRFILMCWGTVTGRLASEQKPLKGGCPLLPSTVHFVRNKIPPVHQNFRQHPCWNPPWYWFPPNLSGRSSFSFFVFLAFSADGIYLLKTQALRQSSSRYLGRMTAE